jgi:hypothetical protein
MRTILVAISVEPGSATSGWSEFSRARWLRNIRTAFHQYVVRSHPETAPRLSDLGISKNQSPRSQPGIGGSIRGCACRAEAVDRRPSTDAGIGHIDLVLVPPKAWLPWSRWSEKYVADLAAWLVWW